MKEFVDKNKVLLKILFAFLIIINFCDISMATESLDNKLELLEKRLNLESEVNILTIIICFILVVAAFFTIIISLFFYNKIPKTVLYIMITICVLIISVVSILFGEEMTAFCNNILEYQMQMVGKNYN